MIIILSSLYILYDPDDEYERLIHILYELKHIGIDETTILALDSFEDFEKTNFTCHNLKD